MIPAYRKDVRLGEKKKSLKKNISKLLAIQSSALETDRMKQDIHSMDSSLGTSVLPAVNLPLLEFSTSPATAIAREEHQQKQQELFVGVML